MSLHWERAGVRVGLLFVFGRRRSPADALGPHPNHLPKGEGTGVVYAHLFIGGAHSSTRVPLNVDIGDGLSTLMCTVKLAVQAASL